MGNGNVRVLKGVTSCCRAGEEGTIKSVHPWMSLVFWGEGQGCWTHVPPKEFNLRSDQKLSEFAHVQPSEWNYKRSCSKKERERERYKVPRGWTLCDSLFVVFFPFVTDFSWILKWFVFFGGHVCRKPRRKIDPRFALWGSSNFQAVQWRELAEESCQRGFYLGFSGFCHSFCLRRRKDCKSPKIAIDPSKT